MSVSFNALAERELNDAAHYYELESPGLGFAFLSEAERVCAAIEAYPEAAPAVLDDIRRRLFVGSPTQSSTARVMITSGYWQS